MHPRTRIAVIVAVGASLLAAGATGFPAVAPERTGPARTLHATAPEPTQESGDFLGFQAGEERRYILGPPSSLVPGEAAEWGIFLSEIVRDGPRRLGVFDLVYRRWEPGGLERTKTLTRFMTARLVLNEAAFPEQLTINEQIWTDLISATYSFEEDRYVKVVRIPEEEWEFRVPIATQRHLDLENHTGLYVFRELTRPSDVLAHPALLGLVLPRPLPPPPWEREMLFFAATGGVRWPGERWIRRERNQPQSTRRYYTHNDVKIVEETEIQIGDRTVNAYRVDVEGAMREIYVDREGRVLRINLDLSQRTRKQLWVRLLFPSEY